MIYANKAISFASPAEQGCAKAQGIQTITMTAFWSLGGIIIMLAPPPPRTQSILKPSNMCSWSNIAIITPVTSREGVRRGRDGGRGKCHTWGAGWLWGGCKFVWQAGSEQIVNGATKLQAQATPRVGNEKITTANLATKNGSVCTVYTRVCLCVWQAC